jgi:hypothetical protein
MTAQSLLSKARGKKVVAPFDQKVEFCQVALTDDQRSILDDLLKLRTATLSRFEIETDRLGQGIAQELDALEAAGWVESQDIEGCLEPKVYNVSPKAFEFLVFGDDN